MRTYLLSNEQKTVVVEIETDAITNLQSNSTIHDINVIKGDLDIFVSSGFYVKIPDVITEAELVVLAAAMNLNLSVINPETGVETSIATADNSFAFTTTTIDAGVQDAVYTPFTVETEYGEGVVTFAATTLPTGLVMSELGVITGTPTADGSFTTTVTATDALGQVISDDFTFVIGDEYTADISLALTTPAPDENNTITVGDAVYTGDVSVENTTASVVVTGTKTAGQTVTLGGTDSAKVTATGTATAPIYTIDTDLIKTTGGTYEFTMTVSETSKTDQVYTVSVIVAAA